MKETSDVIRIPWFYILRALKELSNHLLVKPYQGIFTISWRHSIFSKIVFDRYLSNKRLLLIINNKYKLKTNHKKIKIITMSF